MTKRHFCESQLCYMHARAALDVANANAAPEYDAIDQAAPDDIISAECERIHAKYHLVELGAALREAENDLFSYCWQKVSRLPQYHGSPVGGMFEAIIAGKAAQHRQKLVDICMRLEA